MIPLKDNLRYIPFAWVSVVIFALNVFMYIGEATLDTSGTLQTTISSWLPVREVLHQALANGDPFLFGRSIAALFLAMFLHGSFGHIFGNMCFFFAFAPALEARMGHGKFALFYLGSGVMASLTFLVTDVSGVGHILGASGAIGGVLGAYVLYFPRARVDGLTGTFNFINTLSVFFLAEYVIMQWMSIFIEMGGLGESAGVAFSAHIGGMTTGMIVAAFMLLSDAGRLRVRDFIFYGVTIAATVAMVLFPMGMGYWTRLIVVTSMVLLTWVALFQRPFTGFWQRLGTPAATLMTAILLGFAVDRSIAAAELAQGPLQAVNVYSVCVFVMLATVVMAVAARRLPLAVTPKVITPIYKGEDRLLSEVVYDLVGAFFGWASATAKNLLFTAFRLVAMSWAMLATAYRNYAPMAVQQRLDSMVGGAKARLQAASGNVRRNRLVGYLRTAFGGLKNRLVVEG